MLVHTKVVGYVNMDRRFGFTEDSVFFHFDQELIPLCNGENAPCLVRFEPDYEPTPDKGAEIVCEVVDGKKGKKVLWWAYKLSWDFALESIKNRQTYRLVERIGYEKKSRLSSPLDGKYRVRWEGKDIGELRRLYPENCWELRKTDSYALFFEVLDSLGNWAPAMCDPRHCSLKLELKL